MDAFTPGMLRGLVVSDNARLAAILKAALDMIGIAKTATVAGQDDALAAMTEFAPHFVLIHADIASSAGKALALAVNKKRSGTNRRTPKLLVLDDPTIERVLEAKSLGFWDVVALPTSTAKIRIRLADIFNRLD